MTSAFYFAGASAFLFSGGLYDFQYCNNFTFRIVAGRLAEKAGLPSLPGMILAGIAIGPFCFDIVDGRLMDISRQLRTIALIIIPARAGLSLDMKVLKRLGRPALLMCFLPACTEIAAWLCRRRHFSRCAYTAYIANTLYRCAGLSGGYRPEFQRKAVCVAGIPAKSHSTGGHGCCTAGDGSFLRQSCPCHGGAGNNYHRPAGCISD